MSGITSTPGNVPHFARIHEEFKPADMGIGTKNELVKQKTETNSETTQKFDVLYKRHFKANDHNNASESQKAKIEAGAKTVIESYKNTYGDKIAEAGFQKLGISSDAKSISRGQIDKMFNFAEDQLGRQDTMKNIATSLSESYGAGAKTPIDISENNSGHQLFAALTEKTNSKSAALDLLNKAGISHMSNDPVSTDQLEKLADVAHKDIEARHQALTGIFDRLAEGLGTFPRAESGYDQSQFENYSQDSKQLRNEVQNRLGGSQVVNLTSNIFKRAGIGPGNNQPLSTEQLNTLKDILDKTYQVIPGAYATGAINTVEFAEAFQKADGVAAKKEVFEKLLETRGGDGDINLTGRMLTMVDEFAAEVKNPTGKYTDEYMMNTLEDNMSAILLSNSNNLTSVETGVENQFYYELKMPDKNQVEYE